MKAQTIRDSILVRKDEVAAKSAGGLYLGHVEDKNIKGTVVAVGTGRVSMTGIIIPLDVVVGDKVLFNKTNTNEVKDGEGTLLQMREDNIIVVYR
jgi:chaperonin GroES